VKESIGPVANGGNSGAENGFDSFLASFLNIQDNMYLANATIGVYATIEVGQIGVSQVELMQNVAELDEYVTNLLAPFFEKGKKVILIGGGHNNAYPLMKALHQVERKAIAVLNLDPHADFRILEGRHSGNSFSYAMKEEILSNYGVLGLHQNYNSAEMLDRMHDSEVHFTFFEQYIDKERDFITDINTMLSWMKKIPLGIELDLDAIEYMPSSAKTPSGFSLNDARYYVRRCAKQREARYLHLPEAAPSTDVEKKMVGKSLAYLVSDFIKVNMQYA
jgi:formiminoglutamase